jgi:asparagine synthase (glutamine-hydrolysing)
LCGYLVWITKNSIPRVNFENALNLLAHRGPDDENYYFEGDKLAMGHRRLGIIDPTGGIQPMVSRDNKTVIVFNGAVYNYKELKKELESKGHVFKTSSDTEVVLYAYEEWGDKCVDHFNGMFSIVAYDRSKNRIFAVRDRVGIKPLYYYADGFNFIVASEIKSILACEPVKAKLNNNSLVDYLTFQFYLGEKTLFNGIKRLNAGNMMSVELSSDSFSHKISGYWNICPSESSVDKSEKVLLEEFRELLYDSVRLRLRSDVPLGAHLSGGIDSSVVSVLAAKQLEQRLSTFTGRFTEDAIFDESAYAKAVASDIDSVYHDIVITNDEFKTNLEDIVWYMDEPEAGPGVFSQYMVSQYAKDHVKVILGGQGGDELCVGYVRYLVAYYEEQLKGAISGDSLAIENIKSISGMLHQLDGYQAMIKEQYSSGLFEGSLGRYYKLLNRMDSLQGLINDDVFHSSGYSAYGEMIGIIDDSDFKDSSLIQQMGYLDFKTSLQGLLHVEDRTSMASSIESRVPLLDHRIVEFMFSIPAEIKFKNGELKYFLKKAVSDILPSKVMERKDKKGFPTPLNIWLKGPLNDWVKDILNDQRTRERGIFNKRSLETLIESEGLFNRSAWGVLNLELWHRQFIDK